MTIALFFENLYPHSTMPTDSHKNSLSRHFSRNLFLQKQEALEEIGQTGHFFVLLLTPHHS